MFTKRNILIALNLLLVLLVFNFSVYEKEKTLENGRLVLLELAPVDPRSLMQGDYMELAYAINQEISFPDSPSRGYCVLRVDEHGVAEFIRTQAALQPVSEGELPVKYFRNSWRMNLGAESFFFEEGQAAAYEAAKFGGLKVDEKGNSILVGLYDEEKNLIVPKQ